MPKLKDTDYLSISARVKAMENRLLSRERMERMIDARSNEDAVKILSECGYGEIPVLTVSALDEMLSKARGEVFNDLRGAVPDPKLLDIFQLKYDYHNAKVLIKAEAMGVSASHLLMAGGRYPIAKLVEGYQNGDLREVSDTFRTAVQQSKETLLSSGDPQRGDFVLDRAYFLEMADVAQGVGSDFLSGYVKISIDVVNLRSAVRAARMGKGAEFLSHVLIPNGNVSPSVFASTKGSDLANLFRTGTLSAAATEGAAVAVPHGAPLTTFERLCDNAILAYLGQARRIPFGEHPVIGYLYAREAEGTAIRTILSGRLAGLKGDTIRERLRETYG